MIIGLINRVIAFIRATSAATDESDTEYDGMLSYTWEWHAVEYGLPLGVLTGLSFVFLGTDAGTTMLSVAVAIVLTAVGERSPKDAPIPMRYIKQIRKELHYYLGSFLVGIAPFLPFIPLGQLTTELGLPF